MTKPLPSALELHLREVERAYRRGYFQGAHAALQEVQSGRTVKGLATWLSNLDHWRYILKFHRTPAEGVAWPLPPEMPPLAGGRR